jgi:plasmid stabilization system protein ParE
MELGHESTRSSSQRGRSGHPGNLRRTGASAPGLGNRFVAQVQEILVRLESMPEIYGIVWQDVRAARLKKFRHIVYYVVFDDRVEVLAVMHGARNRSAWQRRA